MDDDPATEILEATYRSLCRRGYADLTVEDIAAEADRSKALVHYYYDSKENLFTEFLEYLYERYTAHLASVAGETPRERLFSLFEAVLADEAATPGEEFRTAMLEVKAQAPYDEAIQANLARFDEYLFERLREIIAAGVESGDFRERVDPATAAEFLATTITGAQTRRVAVGYPTDRLYETMTRYADTHLLVAAAAEGSN
ncbi:TetR/AcrR family transcriptional regulator [Halopelagius longus]|uniref:TetR family transcriptional regulator n=1 Tax=Halopelagius longus TaxID=1236180 RepID=A0A1H0YHS7_9EURY|nr:TetR/AcrR family transcriptional regulator [Halopelagius longus]RDI72497.1 TetR family transcriptional regulator [Halopelagius longus]SDQ14658.1 transcriptional regulator, TetR family [Halopelagius longus]